MGMRFTFPKLPDEPTWYTPPIEAASKQEGDNIVKVITGDQEMIYYFIMYMSKRIGERWEHSEYITKTHPVQWLIDARENHSTETMGGKVIHYEYALTGWKEIPKMVYDGCKDMVG